MSLLGNSKIIIREIRPEDGRYVGTSAFGPARQEVKPGRGWIVPI